MYIHIVPLSSSKQSTLIYLYIYKYILQVRAKPFYYYFWIELFPLISVNLLYNYELLSFILFKGDLCVLLIPLTCVDLR